MSKFNVAMRSAFDKTIVRYLMMAIVLVMVELSIFYLLNSVFSISYLIATPVSLILVIFLNWYFGRVFIFKNNSYKASTEFALVATVSIVGIGIQTCVVWFCVETIKLQPLNGKVIAIIVTFFWNYFVRKRYIFR
ncbi:MAG: GtrA family protein [bacterium]